MENNKIKKQILAVLAIQTGALAFLLHTVSRMVKNVQIDWLYRVFSIADFTTLIFSCIILLAFMYYLNKKHTYKKANLYVYLILLMNVMIFVVSRLEVPPPSLQALILLIYGLATVSFSIQVMKCPDDLGGLKKAYSYITGFSGVCIASIFFLPIGIIVNCVSDIVLGFIFYRIS